MAGTVRILRGIPDTNEPAEPGKYAYPESAIDMAKIIREAGLEPEFEDPPEARSYVGHKAIDIWLPIMQVTSDLSVSMSAGLLTWLLTEFLRPLRKKDIILHAKHVIVEPDGTKHTFEMRGKKRDVIEALSEFEQRFQPQQGHGEVEGSAATDGTSDPPD